MGDYSQKFILDLLSAIDESDSDSEKLKAIETFDRAIWLDLFHIEDDRDNSKFEETYTKILETMVRCGNSDNSEIIKDALRCITRMSYKSIDKSPVYRHPGVYELAMKGVVSTDMDVREESCSLVTLFTENLDIVDELLERPNFLETISDNKFKFIYKSDLMSDLLRSVRCREIVIKNPNKNVRDFFEDYLYYD